MISHDCIVELEGVQKRYEMGMKEVYALRHVDLKIASGESVAIMGPSGSGKSTLMHLIGCLDTPTKGRYLLGGVDVLKLKDSTLSMIRASHIGFVFQSYNLIPQLTVYENVKAPFLYGFQNIENPDKKIQESIERVGLSARSRHLPSELSGGEMQRVAIARALSIDPLLILADEPTGNLDSETGKSILKLFQELNSQGVTLIAVTHDSTVASHFKRQIRMRDGLIVEDTA